MRSETLASTCYTLSDDFVYPSTRVTGVKIGLWNARGLVKKSEERLLLLTDTSIDIILITEIRMRPGLKVYLPVYDQYFANHPSNTA